MRNDDKCFMPKNYPYKGNNFRAVNNQIKSLGRKAIRNSNNQKIDDLISNY